MSLRAVLAIDQGTTSTKAFVLTADGQFTPLGGIAHRQILPGPGLVEHDADQIMAAIDALIDRALTGHPAIDAIAIANQGETVVAFDRTTGAPLHNAIVWQDQRTQGWLDALPAAARAEITARSGLPVDAYFSAGKLAWLLRHVPAVAEAAAAGRLGLGTSDAFMLHRLTGVYGTDVTTASRTSLMNLAGKGWDADLCALFGVPQDLLPPIRPTAHLHGWITRAGRRIPVSVSVVDQQAALYGHGCRAPGEAKITFGTGSFALALTGDAPAGDTRGLVPTVAWHLPPAAPVHALDGGDYTAAAAIDWAMGVGLAQGLADFDFADDSPAIAQGLAFVPVLAGLAAPHWRRDVAAGFLGLTQATGAPDMRKAVLEGIAYRGAALIEALGGTGTAPVSVDGGLVANRYFVQFLANALGRPVRLHATTDLTGLGAAQMAFAAAGQTVAVVAAPALILPDARLGAVQAGRALFDAGLAAVTAFAGARRPGI